MDFAEILRKVCNTLTEGPIIIQRQKRKAGRRTFKEPGNIGVNIVVPAWNYVRHWNDIGPIRDVKLNKFIAPHVHVQAKPSVQ